MADDLKIKIGGDAEGAKAAVAEAANAVKSSSEQIQEHFKRIDESTRRTGDEFAKLNESVYIHLGALTLRLRIFGDYAKEILGFEAIRSSFEKVTENTAQWAFQAENLARKLGISAEQASALNLHAREAGISEGTLNQVLTALNFTLANNEQRIQKLGVATTDSITHAHRPLIDVFNDLIKKMQETKTGIDQNTLAMLGFRRGGQEVQQFLRDFPIDMAKATAEVREFGLEVDAAGVQRAHDWEEAWNKLTLVLLGVENQIGRALLPTITALERVILELVHEGKIAEWAATAGGAIARLPAIIAEVTNSTLLALGRIQIGIGLIAGVLGLATGNLLALGTAAGLITTGVWTESKSFSDDAIKNWEAFGDRVKQIAKEVQDEYNKTGGNLPGTTGTGKGPPSPGAEAAAAKAQMEAFQELMREERTAMEASKDNAAVRLEIVREFTDQVKARFGSVTKFIEQQLTIQETAEREAKDQREKLITDGYDNEKKIREVHDADARALIEARVKRGEEDKAQQLTDLQNLLDQEYAANVDEVNRELALKLGSIQAVEDLKKKLASATTPEQKAEVVTDVQNPQEVQKLLDQLDMLKAKFDSTTLKLHLEIDPDADFLAAKAEAIRGAFDDAFHDMQTAAAALTQSLIEGNQTSAEELNKLRAEVRNTTADVQLEALAVGRQSSQWIQAKNAEISAQSQLDQVIRKQSATEQAIYNAGRQLASQSLNDAEAFVFKTIELQVLRLAAYLTTDKAILASDKLTGTDLIAFKLGTWALEKLGVISKEAAISTTEKIGAAERVTTKTGEETLKTSAQVVGDQARVASTVAATTEKEVVEAASTDKSLLASAAEAAGKLIASFASLPYGVGIAIGVAAAAGVTALILGLMGKFEQGGEASDDMLGILHPKEMVLPPHMADRVRRFAGAPTGAHELIASAHGIGLGDVAPGTNVKLTKGSMVLPASLAETVRAQAAQPAAVTPRGAAASPASPAAAEAAEHGGGPGHLGAHKTTGSAIIAPALAEAVRGQESGRSGGGLRTVSGIAEQRWMSGELLSAARGLESVPAGGAVATLHEREMVLPASTAEAVRAGAAGKTGSSTPTTGGGGGGGGGGDEGHGGPHGGSERVQKHEHKHEHTVGNQAAAAITNAVQLGGSAGGKKVQDVSIVGAPASVKMSAQGGHLETTIRSAQTPVGITAAQGGDPIPTAPSGVQQVMVSNVPLRVTFTAIQTQLMLSTFAAPFGVGVGITAGFGMINAFARGGDVPEDMLAKLHQKEMVLPADIAEGFRNMMKAAAVAGPGLSFPQPSLGRSISISDSTTRASSESTTVHAGDQLAVNVDYKCLGVPEEKEALAKHTKFLAKEIAGHLKNTNPGRRH